MTSEILDSIMKALQARNSEKDTEEADTWATLLRVAAEELEADNGQGSD